VTAIVCDTCGVIFSIHTTRPVSPQEYEDAAEEQGWEKTGTYEDGSQRWTCPDTAAHDPGLMGALTRAVRQGTTRILDRLVEDPEARARVVKLGKEALEKLRRG